MPNWCQNSLVITTAKKMGSLPHEKSQFESSESLAQLKQVNKLILADNDINAKDGSIKGFQLFVSSEQNKCWYENNVANWGTKWNINDWNFQQLDEDDESHTIHAYFDTAWAPPLAFVRHMSEKYPDLLIGLQYEEWGMDFGGFEIYRNGERIDVDEHSIFDHLQKAYPSRNWEEDNDDAYGLYAESVKSVDDYIDIHKTAYELGLR